MKFSAFKGGFIFQSHHDFLAERVQAGPGNMESSEVFVNLRIDVGVIEDGRQQDPLAQRRLFLTRRVEANAGGRRRLSVTA
jgi:hypothetical protein